MKFIKFTYVDSVTGISVQREAASNGPAFPAVAGLEYVWARESLYPTDVPEFFGTCPEESDTAVDGVIGVFSKVDWDNMREDEMRARLPPVPQEVSMGQCRLALFDLHGIETDAEFYALADFLPEELRPRARLQLSTRQSVRYDNELVIAICEANGWDREALFVHGAAQ